MPKNCRHTSVPVGACRMGIGGCKLLYQSSSSLHPVWLSSSGHRVPRERYRGGRLARSAFSPTRGCKSDGYFRIDSAHTNTDYSSIPNRFYLNQHLDSHVDQLIHDMRFSYQKDPIYYTAQHQFQLYYSQ